MTIRLSMSVHLPLIKSNSMKLLKPSTVREKGLIRGPGGSGSLQREQWIAVLDLYANMDVEQVVDQEAAIRHKNIIQDVLIQAEENPEWAEDMKGTFKVTKAYGTAKKLIMAPCYRRDAQTATELQAAMNFFIGLGGGRVRAGKPPTFGPRRALQLKLSEALGNGGGGKNRNRKNQRKR